MSIDDLRRLLGYLEDAQTLLDGVVSHQPTEGKVFEYVAKARKYTILALEMRERRRELIEGRGSIRKTSTK